MSTERNKERIIELIQKMRNQTFDKGCTPSEAAGFAAKVAEWVERYQISEAELSASSGDTPEVEVCQNTLRTGKKVFNPGMTAVVSGLAVGACCKVILLQQNGEAVYGIVGDQLDADYVCQIATTVVPSLQLMAGLEGREHGYEKAGLVRWSNQYLQGAGEEIRRRLEKDRKDRSDIKQIEHQLAVAQGVACTALVVTGESIATTKRAAVEEAFRGMYPRTRKTFSRSSYDGTAQQCGREAGKRVGLNIAIE